LDFEFVFGNKSVIASTKPRQKSRDMTIKPIKTERDYHKALKEIEKLWDAKPSSTRRNNGRKKFFCAGHPCLLDLPAIG
jgi:hypothetical protein